MLSRTLQCCLSFPLAEHVQNIKALSMNTCVPRHSRGRGWFPSNTGPSVLLSGFCVTSLAEFFSSYHLCRWRIGNSIPVFPLPTHTHPSLEYSSFRAWKSKKHKTGSNHWTKLSHEGCGCMWRPLRSFVNTPYIPNCFPHLSTLHLWLDLNLWPFL